MSSERIGTITTTESTTRRVGYECAAWFRDVRCEPQTSDLYLTRTPEGRPSMLHWGLSGVTVDASFLSLWAGVPISGKDDAGKRAVGEEYAVPVSVYVHSLPKLAGVTLDEGYKWLQDDSQWSREQADRALRRELERGGRWRSLSCWISEEFVRKHGSPELVAQMV